MMIHNEPTLPLTTPIEVDRTAQMMETANHVTFPKIMNTNSGSYDLRPPREANRSNVSRNKYRQPNPYTYAINRTKSNVPSM